MLQENSIFSDIAEQLDKVLKDVETYRSIYQISREKAENEINIYTMCKEKAVLGEKNAREYVINQYIKLMSSRVMNITDEKIKAMINFDDLQDNHVQVLFEMLLDIFDIQELLERYNLSVRINESDIRRIVECEKAEIRDKFSDYHSKLKFIASLAFAGEYGQDCIDTLQFQSINEIGIIDSSYIYIVHNGAKVFLDFLKLRDRNVILNIQKKTTQNSPVNYDEQNPSVVASKNNSSRITVAGYSLTPSEEELYYNERIFSLKKITLEEMRDSYRTIDELVYKMLCINQKGRGSHFITGSDMGVGKSTFLLAMMEKIPDWWGIGILDTQNELQARKKFPWKNIKTLIQNPKRSISECFALQLKMARDVLYVGEITLPSEAAELINASLRLNAGVGATMHSFSPYEVVTNLRNLMMRTEMYNNADTAEADIARSLDIIIHLARHPADKKRIVVDKIVEIVPTENEIQVSPALNASDRVKISNLLDMAQLALYKYLFPGKYYYNTIISFDYDTDTWKPINLPSEKYFKKISRYVDEGEIKSCINAFKSNGCGGTGEVR